MSLASEMFAQGVQQAFDDFGWQSLPMFEDPQWDGAWLSAHESFRSGYRAQWDHSSLLDAS